MEEATDTDRTQPIRPQRRFTPPKQPLSEEGDLILLPPSPLPYDRTEKSKYYEWHQHHQHNTHDIITLKNQVKNMIEKGVIKVVKPSLPIKEANKKLGIYVNPLPASAPQPNAPPATATETSVSDSKGKTTVSIIHEEL
ncbi:hypothetical protein AMTR_s00054p00105960 [Amborella trichopoda]|uniref:Uncharacterized protein n=1 Tax=Amborella trichopoda TaxID=13333 RepID=U5DCM2_AMBTC|nr:hypothetical protein AMTR_s00054p00105960 [Amborella trichopoda]